MFHLANAVTLIRPEFFFFFFFFVLIALASVRRDFQRFDKIESLANAAFSDVALNSVVAIEIDLDFA